MKFDVVVKLIVPAVLEKLLPMKPPELASNLNRMLALQIIERVGKTRRGYKTSLREARGTAEIEPKIGHRDLRQPDRSSYTVRNTVIA